MKNSIGSFQRLASNLETTLMVLEMLTLYPTSISGFGLECTGMTGNSSTSTTGETLRLESHFTAGPRYRAKRSGKEYEI